MRLALGCQHLTLEAAEVALRLGVTIFDTARAYGRSEALLGAALAGKAARVVTKCGMREGWTPDGRASSIRADLDASLDALSGTPIDTLLLHVPDPKVDLATSLRALAAARERGQVRRIGLSNVSRRQLEEAAAVTRIDAVEVALGAYDDASVRGGVLAWCDAHDAVLYGYAPFGGAKRAARLLSDVTLRAVGARVGATPHEVLLAYLGALSPRLVPVVGAHREETIASAVRGVELTLDQEALDALDLRFVGLAMARPRRDRPRIPGREVVIVMGLPGSGKSTAVASWVSRGYERLNRDTLGGTLRGIAKRLDALLEGGAPRVVLDNTYVTRATRSEIVRLARHHGAASRCVWLDTPAHEAEQNVAIRILERHGRLLEPAELLRAAKTDPGVLAPSALGRMTRDFEPPAKDEGFDIIDVVPFARAPFGEGQGTLVARAAFDRGGIPEAGPVLVFDWRAGGAAEDLGPRVETALCAHPAGPPVCWCRPPLPGFWVAFAAKHRLSPARSLLVGTGPVHRTMASRLGLAYEERA